MIDFTECELLETLVCEYEYSTTHGLTQNAAAAMRNIRRNLDGLLKRYKNCIPDSDMTEILKMAAMIYGKQRPDTGFVDFLLYHIGLYAKDHNIRIRIDGDTLHMETIQANGFRGNGYESFCYRDNTSVPETLAISFCQKKGKAPPKNKTEPENVTDREPDVLEDDQTDEEISNLIDSILGFD